MIKTHVVLLLVLTLWSIQGLNSPIYTHQVILWGGAGTARTQNSVSTFNYPFPAGALYDNNYNRDLALSGLKADLSDTIDFSLALQPYASDAYADIDVNVGPIELYSLAVHVMFVNATCDFLWIASGVHTFVDLSDQNGAVETEAFTVTTPPVLTSSSHFQIYHFIQHLKIQTYVNSSTNLGIQVNYVSKTNPSTLRFTTTRTSLSSFQAVGVVAVAIKRSGLSTNKVARYAFNHTETQSVPATPFDITFPGIWLNLNSSFGGVQGECILGFHSFLFGGDRSITTSRSILFLQDDIPFTSVQKIIPSGETFLGEWRGLCIMACPTFTTYSSYNCVIPPPITNCQSQINATHCAICNSGYFLNPLGTGCLNCLSNTGGSCATCDNQTICLTCVSPTTFALANSSCLRCSDLISDCLQCTSSSTCTQCTNDSFYLVADTCEHCNISIPDCVRCSSSSVCDQCDSGFVLLGNSVCLNCTIYSPGCTVCSFTSCSACLTGYILVAGNCELCSNPYVMLNGACLSCSDAITNCSTCLSSTFCTSCLDQYTYLHYITSTSQLCFECQLSLQYCLTCSSQTVCTSCLNNSYYLDSNSKCLACGSALPGCSECYTSGSGIKCSLCSSQIYLLNSTEQCQLCSLYIGNCSTCSNQTECLQCQNSSYTFFSNRTSCLQCSDIFSYCQQCNEDRCTVCPPGMHSVDGWMSCQCIIGQLVGRICSQIVGCTNIVLDPQGQQLCLFCNTDYFQLQPVNNLCVCLNGQLINGICSTILGCILPFINSDGTQTCLFCNISRGFSGKPVNNTCVCMDKFQNINGNCMEICGDGYYMGSYQCDDGNLDDSDGCSSTCQVEVGYRCYNGSSQQPSTCVYEGIPVSIQLKRITRVGELNQGLFEFSLSPALVNINKMNLSQYVQLTCVDTVYEVSKVQYSASGELSLTADFSTDMEGRQCNLTLSFDKSIIVSPNSTIDFSADSETLKLVIITKQQQYRMIKLIFTYLGYAAVAIFLISLGYKMIGAELMTCCQLVYFSNAFYKKQFFFFSQTQGLKSVTGGWSLFYDYNDSQFMMPFTQRVQMTPYFLENNVIVVAVLTVGMALWLLLQAIHYHRTTARKEEGYKITVAQKKCLDKISIITRLIYQTVVFPVAAGFTIVLLVSAETATFGGSTRSNDSSFFPQTINSSVMLVTILMLAVVFGVEFIQSMVLADKRYAQKRSLRGLQEAKPWYVKLFLTRSVLFVLMIEVGITKSYALLIYLITLLEVAYFFLIIITKPYYRKIDNLGLIIFQGTTLMSFTIPLAMNFFSMEQAMEVLITFILQGFLIITLFVTFIRLLLHYKLLIRKIIFSNSLENQIDIQIEQGAVGKAMSQDFDQSHISNKMRIEEHQQPINVMTNKYSLYCKKQYQGKEMLLPKSKLQQQKRKVIVPSDSRVVFQDEEDEEVKAIKEKLRESLVQNKAKKQQ